MWVSMTIRLDALSPLGSWDRPAIHDSVQKPCGTKGSQWVALGLNQTHSTTVLTLIEKLYLQRKILGSLEEITTLRILGPTEPLRTQHESRLAGVHTVRVLRSPGRR